MNKKLSYIIPAYNEEKNIIRTLEKIDLYTPDKYDYEIIVVDHGSEDKTVGIARKFGAKVFVKNDGTIAELRNYGVYNSQGNVLIFIDSDISLTKQWNENIGVVIESLRRGKRLLTGSVYTVPENPNWIEKYWFKPLESIDRSYINSGHLIISRILFDELNGFDEDLETGEDYDISMRAKRLGIGIEDNHKLKVIHEGYPDGLLEFISREYWHGKGDAGSLNEIIGSKVALVSLLLFFFHVVLVISIFFNLDVKLLVTSLFGIMFLCFFVSLMKYRRESIKIIIINAFIYYFYLSSRAFSLLTIIFNRKKMKKRQR